MANDAFDAERFAAALQHQPQLLRLAARLLGDGDAAEDAVGHALLQESRGRRREAVPLLPFLRAAVRNMARKMRRAAATRQQYEQAAARDEAVPAADELAAREQLRRRVADAVLALAEPYRTTVALVWLEERSVAEVAQRFGTAEATIRVRLHRARDELRRRLDRDYGSRVAWGALVAWRWPSVAVPAAVAGGAMAMKKMLAFAVLALLVLGGGVWLVWPPDAAPPPIVLAARPAVADVASGTPTPAARAAIANAPRAAAPHEQRIRCVDERGAPIAGAEVRLLHMPYGSGVPDLVATSGADGVAVFADVPAAFYLTAARLGIGRHHVRDIEHSGANLPAAPFDVVLQELWVGGLEMPGVEGRQLGFAYRGFQATQDGLAEQGWTDAWQRAHPGSNAILLAMFRDRRRVLSDAIPVTVLWFGHEVARREVRMWPASQFPGPELVDATSVPTIDWTVVRVVLTDAADQPLPESQQLALRPRAQLWRVVDRLGRRTPDMGQAFPFAGGTAKLPCGDYELRLFDAATSQFRVVRCCSVARETTELRLAVPTRDRVVRVHLRGLANSGYMLHAVHENGRKAIDFGTASGEHVLLLPPGLCTLTLRRGEGDAQETVTRALTVTQDEEQMVEWDVSRR